MWGTMQSPVARNDDRSNKCCDNSSSELSRATHPHKNSQYVHSRVFQRNRPSSLPLFHGVTHQVVFVDASMSRSFVGERSLMLVSTDGRFSTRCCPSRCRKLTFVDFAKRARAVATQPGRKRTSNGAIDSVRTLAYYSMSVLIAKPTVR